VKLITIVVVSAGCERPSPSESGRDLSPPPVARVEVVGPERRTVRRTVGEPGPLQAFEAAEVHARIPGYVKGWPANIGDAVRNGPAPGGACCPRARGRAGQKEAAIEKAAARHERAEAAVEVAGADVAGSQANLAEARAGVHHPDAYVVRWRAELRRVEPLFEARAQTGTLLDETRSKSRAADAALEEVRAQVKSAEVGLVQARAVLDRARSDVAAAAAAIDVATADAHHARAMLAYARIEAPLTASSSGGTSTRAT
jgi:hypothetical protein